MSKASDGIVLKPLTGAELMKQHEDSVANGTIKPATPTSRYVTPSKRTEEEKAVLASPTAEQLGSETSFPSLPTMKPLMKGASWAQLRTRLTTPPATPTPSSEPDTSMKERIEATMKKSLLEQEEQEKIEAITDPLLMSRSQLSKNGWVTLDIKNTAKAIHSLNADPEYTEPPYEWPTPTLQFSAYKMSTRLLQPFYTDGRPLER